MLFNAHHILSLYQSVFRHGVSIGVTKSLLYTQSEKHHYRLSLAYEHDLGLIAEKKMATQGDPGELYFLLGEDWDFSFKLSRPIKRANCFWDRSYADYTIHDNALMSELVFHGNRTSWDENLALWRIMDLIETVSISDSYLHESVSINSLPLIMAKTD